MQKPRADKYAEIPRTVSKELEELVAPHVDSFDFFLEEGIRLIINDLDKYEMKVGPEGQKKSYTYWVEEVRVGKPVSQDEVKSQQRIKTKLLDSPLYPMECRETRRTYESPFSLTFCIKETDGESPEERFEDRAGFIPIMLKSKICRLNNLTPKELLAQKEEMNEVGGYFIVNGNEKVIRLLQINRRNYPLAIYRPSFSKIGQGYTAYGVSMRCVRPDQTSQTITLNYTSDGRINSRVIIRRQEFVIPLVTLLKALVDTTDREIYEKLMSIPTGYNYNDSINEVDGAQAKNNNNLVSDNIEKLLRDAKTSNLYSKEQCLIYLGSSFRIQLDISDKTSDLQAGILFLKKYILVHLISDYDKFNSLLLMTRKLFALVQHEIEPDNLDSPHTQEVLLPGQLYGMLFKERLDISLSSVRDAVQKDIQGKFNASSAQNSRFQYFGVDILKSFKKSIWTVSDVGAKLRNFLATGNMNTVTGVDLNQKSGFTIIAERLNYLRYLSHFRSIHRGAFFAEMKTTEPRKLLPESWGFLCPVHTPDGAPCGLLNHLATPTKLVCDLGGGDGNLSVNYSNVHNTVYNLLITLGISSFESGYWDQDSSSSSNLSNYLIVVLDGRVVGKVNTKKAQDIVDRIRLAKVKRAINANIEVAYITPMRTGDLLGGQGFPGIYIFTTPTRFMRPVKNLKAGGIEMIGSLEQVYLNIACVNSDITSKTTHIEISPTNILSIVADLTPFSDFNQSPRNMYQCQMGKQTMGTPIHGWGFSNHNKLYRIQNPQTPVVRTFGQDRYPLDDYPNGANAIVAVISYTGYDMEDAMIINKSSYERGFGHGSVYKSEIVEPNANAKRNDVRVFFSNSKDGQTSVDPNLDLDGLPFVGSKVEKDTPFYSYYNPISDSYKITKWKSNEPAIVDGVTTISYTRSKVKLDQFMSEDRIKTSTSKSGNIEKAIIKLRYDRNPVIGDKFSSRHGQKGVLSQLWPQVDMPFSESGLSPDVIINPHAFPSRMTIGMLVESMAGKAGSLHGVFQDATPFRYDEKNTAVQYFGEQLKKAGYNYYGNEPMYSGIMGTEFKADIYLGVVYYQRLRHMVKDKYQVRATGSVNSITQQPIKGRKVGGGIRVGEMERDSLLAHGISHVIYDRLFFSSDYSMAHVCNHCKSIISAVPTSAATKDVTCRTCETHKYIKVLPVPFIFKYLVAELAAMNIKVMLDVK